MKKRTNIVLAAFMFALTLAAVPRHASAATDIYLQLDGIKGESQSIMPWVSIALSLIA